MKVRLNIIQNIINNWDTYKSYILGNSYYQDVLNSKDYEQLLSQNSIYGSEIEILSFVRLYNVNVIVHFPNLKIIHSFGDNLNNYQLKLLFSGKLDSGHYDALHCENTNFQSTLIKSKNDKYNRKKKVNNDCINDHVSKNKRLKLTKSTVWVYPKNLPETKKEYTYLSELSHHVDPMVFPLMFPLGDLEWSIGHSKKPNSV